MEIVCSLEATTPWYYLILTNYLLILTSWIQFTCPMGSININTGRMLRCYIIFIYIWIRRRTEIWDFLWVDLFLTPEYINLPLCCLCSLYLNHLIWTIQVMWQHYKTNTFYIKMIHIIVKLTLKLMRRFCKSSSLLMYLHSIYTLWSQCKRIPCT